MTDMIEDWTCPCGHEIDPDDDSCLVWDSRDLMHRVPRFANHCECHGISITQLESPR